MQHSQGVYFGRSTFSESQAIFLDLFLRESLYKSLDMFIYTYHVQGWSYIRCLLITQGKAYPFMKTVHRRELITLCFQNCHLISYCLFLLVKHLKFFLLIYLFSKLLFLRLEGGLSRKKPTQHVQSPRVHSQYQGQGMLSRSFIEVQGLYWGLNQRSYICQVGALLQSSNQEFHTLPRFNMNQGCVFLASYPSINQDRKDILIYPQWQNKTYSQSSKQANYKEYIKSVYLGPV